MDRQKRNLPVTKQEAISNEDLRSASVNHKVGPSDIATEATSQKPGYPSYLGRETCAFKGDVCMLGLD